MSNTSTSQKQQSKQRVSTIIGAILCAILLPILIINITLIVKSYIHEDEVPAIGGVFPMIVLTDSMHPEIAAGDLIICNMVEAEDVQVEDIISFYDPMGNGTTVVTHRVLEILEEDGDLAFRTKGDNNNAEDQVLVSAKSVIGVYRNRIPGAGHIAMFMQTTPGLILCCVCPALLMVLWDTIRRRKYERTKQQDTDALLAELEALRALKAEQESKQ